MKRMVVAVLLVVAGCSNVTQKPIEFDFQGKSVGTKITDEIAAKLAQEGYHAIGKSEQRFFKKFDFIGGIESEITLVVLNDSLEGVLIEYAATTPTHRESSQELMRDAYSTKFGNHHGIDDRERFFWATTNGYLRVGKTSTTMYSNLLSEFLKRDEQHEKDLITKDL